MENATKEVYFCECQTCVHFEKDETEKPCCDCLATFHRPDSHKPLYYEGKDGDGCGVATTKQCMKALRKEQR